MMESMHYVNIFETKGIEYLLVITFLIGFVFFVRRLTYSHTETVPAATTESVANTVARDMVCPAGADCPHEQNRRVATAMDSDVAEVT